MKRRQYLFTVGTATAAFSFLAGCTGAEGDTGGNGEPSTASEGENESGEETETETETEAEEETDPAQAAKGENIEEYKGLQITEHELVNEGDEYFDDMRINGIVENTRDESLDYVEVRARVYDSDGNQLDSYFDNTTDLQAGGSWKFSVYILDEEAEIGDYDIQVKDTPF